MLFILSITNNNTKITHATENTLIKFECNFNLKFMRL